MPALKDITGNRYGRLLVIEYVGTKRSPTNGLTATQWLCRCDCGKEVVAPKHSLTSGNKRSCGCLKADQNRAIWTTHGKTNTRLYRIWNAMKYRCDDISSPAYKYYGGKGVAVCKEWKGRDGFQRFYQWAISNGYKDDLTIERIDVNGDYRPENCTWVTQAEQMRNRTNTHWIYYKGTRHTLSEASKVFNADRATIRKYAKACDGDTEKAIQLILDKREKKARAM